MNYESIILELMERIQTLEKKQEELEKRVTALEAGEDPGEGSDPRPKGPRQRGGYTATTDEMIDACYEKGKFAWQHKMFSPYEIRPLAEEVAKETDMNENSANMYIYVVASMLKGAVYKRAINMTATQRYFERIRQDFGQEALERAVSATRQHILYRQKLGHLVSHLIALCDQYEQKA